MATRGISLAQGHNHRSGRCRWFRSNLMRRFLAAFCLCICIVGVGAASACRHTPPTITTPQGVVAYQTEDAVDALNALQHEAIVLSRAGKLSRATALKIVRYRRSATAVIDKA